MNLRSRLTYANVAATLALLLAIGGGTVYAAVQIGRNDVKSKNIAKGAVRNSDVASDAVTGDKVRDGTLTGADLQDGTINAGNIQDGSITADDIVAGVIPRLHADVTGFATGGPQGAINTNTSSPLALSGTTSFTPEPGDVAVLAAEGHFTLASVNAAQFCGPGVRVLVNGEPTRIFVEPESENTNSTTPIETSGRDAAGPYGLLDPGTPLNITAEIRGDAHCTAGSQLDKLVVSLIQLH